MFKHPLHLFRIIGISEGISYLVLLCIAMPLKYFADLPMAVSITGMLHGILFVLYLFALVWVTTHLKWSWKRVVTAFVASIIPIGNFIFDIQLRKEAKELVNPTSEASAKNQ